MLKVLKQAGYKLTSPRRAVVRWISKHRGIFSANEAIKALPTVDRVSVYRTLEILAEIDAIHPVLTNHGEVHYEKHEKKHHHHVVCTGCEKTSCVKCDVTEKKVKGFTNIHHSLVLTGLCVQCS